MRGMVSGLGLGVLLVGCNGGGQNTEGLEPILRRWEQPVQIVVVDSSEGSVTLNGSNSRVVDATFTPTRDGDNFQAGLNQGRLTIGAICQDGSRGCGTNIALDLPKDVEFEIVTDRGNVEINNMGFVGTIVTTTGTITGTGLEQLDLTTTATLGADQDLSYRLRPPVVAMDAGQQGNITIRLPAGEYDFDIQTSGSTLFETGDVADDPTDDTVIQLRSGVGDVVVTKS